MTSESKPLTGLELRQIEQDIRVDERNKTIKDVCAAVHQALKPVLMDLDVIGPDDTSTLTMVGMAVDEINWARRDMVELRKVYEAEIHQMKLEIERLKGIEPNVPF